MKTKLFTLFFALVASVEFICASVTIDGIAYNLNDAELTAEVVSGGDYTGEIVIPASVTYNQKIYSVTTIGDYAFQGCTGLTNITIPNSVTSIGTFAFAGCRNLTSITIPNNTSSIGKKAFNNCIGLTSIIVESGNSIYDSRNNCNAIIETATNTLITGCQSTTIPNGVTNIGDNAFAGCTGLTSIAIPNGVTSIGDDAFCRCSNLTNLSIGNNVTSIGEYAFYSCSSLTAITIPNSVTNIGDNAFSGCTGLTAITIPNGVTSIGDGAFFNCSGLTSVTIGNSVTSIGAKAFYKCTGLTSVTIGYSVTSIGANAFYKCTGLTSVTIGNSVTSIGDVAFSSCSNLTTITMQAEIPPSLGSAVFYGTNISYIYVPCGSLNAYQSSWSDYASLIKYAPFPTFEIKVENQDAGRVSYPTGNLTICDNPITIEAVPNYGYHFTQWSDGNTDNPRTIVVTQDTTFTAEFAKNEYTITTAVSNNEWGSTTGGKKALYLDEVEISATSNYGYHFVSWNDGNSSNPRTITVTKDETYTATFAKDVYSITQITISEQGTISGNTQAEYLDFVTLEAVPNYGYHFTQWSDGLKDNPRIVQLTRDTTFTAEFAYDRVGTCGKDLALVWSYDPTTKVLTIGNEGAFTENMQYGVEAPGEMEELVIGHNVTSIGDRAFAGIETLKKVTIGESVKTIGEQAFYNCVNLETIYNYRPTPTNAYSTAFDGVDKFECALYVLPNSIDMYKNASVWRDFYYTYALGATAATVNEVSVTPTVNTAAVAWPAVGNAFTYELVIKDKSGNVVCTLVFNANGQLTSIAFAAPGRSQVSTQATGFSFTVTGLDSGTGYDLTISAKNSEGEVINTTTQSFTTASDVTTGVDDIESTAKFGGQKILRNGHLLILRDGKTYTIQGQEVR